jgi:hypothetical protein
MERKRIRWLIRFCFAVHTARPERAQGDGELGEEVELSAARDREVPDVH